MWKEILILDEATSELDIETDKFIQNSIEKLTNKMTIIIVAHKLDLSSMSVGEEPNRRVRIYPRG